MGTEHGRRDYYREWHARKLAERIPGPDGRLVAPNVRHGECASYVNYGCRCPGCTAANAATRASYRAAKVS